MRPGSSPKRLGICPHKRASVDHHWFGLAAVLLERTVADDEPTRPCLCPIFTAPPDFAVHGSPLPSVVRVLDASGRGDLLGGPARRGVSPGKALRRTSRVFPLARAGPRQSRSKREPERPPTRPFGCGSQRPSHSDSSKQTSCLAETCGMSTGPFAARRKFFPRGESITEEGVILAGRTTDGKTSFGPLGFHRRGRLVLVPA